MPKGSEETPGPGFEKILIPVKFFFVWCYMYSFILKGNRVMSDILTTRPGFFEGDAVRRELVGVGDFESASVQKIAAVRQKPVAPSAV